MPRKALIWAGAALLLIGAAAAITIILLDRYGPSPGIGYIQVGGIAAGMLVMLAGLAALFPDRSLPLFNRIRAALNSNRPRLFVLIAVLLLAYLLRVYALDSRRIWLDEMFTWDAATGATLLDVLRGTPPYWMPGPLLGMWAWMRVAGQTPFALRYLPVLWGMVSTAALYSVGRRLISHRAGLAAALIFAVSSLPIAYAQETRPYSALLAATLISTWLFLRLLPYTRRGDQPPVRLLLACFGAALLTANIHYMGLVLLAVHGLIFTVSLITHLKNWRVGLQPPLILLLTAAVAGGILLALAPELSSAEWIPAPGPLPAALWSVLAEIFSRQLWIIIPVLMLIAAGVTRHLIERQRPAYAVLPILLAWLLIPPVVLWVGSRLVNPMFLIRYMIYTAPAAYLLLAFALNRLFPDGLTFTAALGIVVAVFLYDLTFIHWRYNESSGEAVRSVHEAALEAGAGEPGSLIALQDWANRLVPHLYRYPFVVLGSDRQPDLPGGELEDIPALEAAIATGEYDTLYLIEIEKPVDPAFMAYLYEHYQGVAQIGSPGAELWIFDLTPAEQTSP